MIVAIFLKEMAPNFIGRYQIMIFDCVFWGGVERGGSQQDMPLELMKPQYAI